ncbi:MAG: DUF3187 family protein [Deltaproteobacteria bacterium]|nr:DUF3187 family protein [Deltaproteobacteria bacterium]
MGVALAIPCFAHAATSYPGFGPIVSRIQQPVYLTNLTLTPTGATTLERGEFQSVTHFAYSNIFERVVSGTTNLDMDMELMRLALDLRYGWHDRFDIGVEIPFLHFDGGFLDGFIDAYHRAFGFPRGGRERVTSDRFLYHFDDNGVTLFDLPSETFDVGDVTFRLKHHFIDEGRLMPAMAWFFDFKIPTGDEGRGLGNGHSDMGLGVALEKSIGRFHGYTNVAALTLSGRDGLEGYQYNQQFVYVIAGEITLLENLSVIAQLNGGTPLLKGTTTHIWNGVPLDLVIGFKGEERDFFDQHDLIWQVAFAEDVTSRGPSVDFTAYLSIGVRLDTLAKR